MKRLRGYGLQKRRRIFFSQHPFCVDCQREGRKKIATELDHIVPIHKGGADKWDNLQGLCAEHHEAKTRKDMGYKPKGCDVNGYPVDSEHHWNK